MKFADNPEDPLWKSNDWYKIGMVWEYFKVVQATATRCVHEFEELEGIAKRRFNALSEKAQDVLFGNSLRALKEETPIKVLREMVTDEEYQGSLGSLHNNSF